MSWPTRGMGGSGGDVVTWPVRGFGPQTVRFIPVPGFGAQCVESSVSAPMVAALLDASEVDVVVSLDGVSSAVTVPVVVARTSASSVDVLADAPEVAAALSAAAVRSTGYHAGLTVAVSAGRVVVSVRVETAEGNWGAPLVHADGCACCR